MPEEQALLTAAKQTRAAWHDKLDLAVKAVSSGDFNPGTMAVFLQAGRTEGEAAIQSLVALRDFKVNFHDRGCCSPVS